MRHFPTVRLRAIEPEDIELLYGIENDRRLWNVGVTNVPYSHYVIRDYIANTSSDIYTDKQLRLIVENEDGIAVGIVDLVNFDPRHLRAEIGVVILDAHRRHGYAYSALSQLLDYALSVLHLNQLYAFVAADNEACRSLFSKLGFDSSANIRQWLLGDNGFEDAVLMTRLL